MTNSTINRPEGSVRPAPWANAFGAIDFNSPGAPTRPTNWSEARIVAGLDWEPMLEPATRNILTMGEDGIPAKKEQAVPGHQWIIRSDTGAVLEHAKDTYHTITNASFGKLVDAFLSDTTHPLRIAVLGQSYGGRKVWALLEPADGRPLHIPGDPSTYERYILICNSHDGSGACRTMDVTNRTICQNMWNAQSMNNKARGGNMKSFYHRSGWQQHMGALVAEVTEAISLGMNSLEAFATGMTDLLATKVTPAQAEWFLTEFPQRVMLRGEPGENEKKRAHDETMREELRAIMHSSTSTGIEGTAGWLANSTSEYLDHGRQVRNGSDAYLQRTVLGTEKKKTNAITLAREAALATV